jgi:chromosome partitioning protein
MLITLANQKGGTGKTTLATNLAGAFAADRRCVVLVDIDPQRSALEWAETRPEAVPQIPVLSLQGAEDAWRRALAPLREAYEVIMLDTGGRISPAVRNAVSVADFLLVPTLASLPDVRSTETFYGLDHRVGHFRPLSIMT